MNENKPQLTLYLTKTNAQQSNINYKRRSVKEAVACLIVVASVQPVAFITLRPLRQLRQLRCVRCVRCVPCVGWKPRETPPMNPTDVTPPPSRVLI